MKSKRIAFVNQRYGLEVNGGSEYYTREIAEHLKCNYDIEVLTTKALDYVTWKNYYEKDVESINGIVVRRFNVDVSRDMAEFSVLTNQIEHNRNRTIDEEEDWVNRQGPQSKGLIDYIEKHYDEYDAFVFVTYLYYHTVNGLPKVADKSILIPTAHDEPFIYFDIYKKIFNCPKGIIFLTDEERDFVHGVFQNSHIKHDVIALGVESTTIPKPIQFKHQYQLDEYVIYVGRIDSGKNCEELFRYFLKYKKNNPKSLLQLVLLGKKEIKIPSHKDIKYLGFLSEDEKISAIMGAKMMILPSKYESLSIAVLEAMYLYKPVIVNGESEVLKGHCIKSNAGLYYTNFSEFERCLEYLNHNHNDYKIMCKNAGAYVRENYSWDKALSRFDDMLKYVCSEE